MRSIQECKVTGYFAPEHGIKAEVKMAQSTWKEILGASKPNHVGTLGMV